MAFENPLIRPSNVRKSSLDYLWSDENFGDTLSSSPTISMAFGIDDAVSKSSDVIGNIVNNGGEYNPNDTTDYSSYTLNNPVESWQAWDQYGEKALNTLKMFGIPSIMLKAAGSAIEQNYANIYSDLINNIVGPYGGEMADKGSVLGAFAKGLVPFVDLTGDDVKSLKNLRDQFDSTDATVGYFNAAVDPVARQISESLVSNPSEITPAQFGIIGYGVTDYIQKQVASGDDLNAAYAKAAEYFAPETAISIPVAETTVIGQDLGTLDNPLLSYTSDTGPLTGNAFNNGYAAGTVWRDASGQVITSGDGAPIFTKEGMLQAEVEAQAAAKAEADRVAAEQARQAEAARVAAEQEAARQAAAAEAARQAEAARLAAEAEAAKVAQARASTTPVTGRSGGTAYSGSFGGGWSDGGSGVGVGGGSVGAGGGNAAGGYSYGGW